MEGEPVTAEENRMEGESVRAVENGMEGAPMTGDENANTSWVMEVEKMLAASRSVESAQWRKQSIYRVPKWIKDMNSKAYQPQLVSLGPFHHGDSNLLPMEEHKRRALVHRVKRSGKPLQDFIAAVEGVADELEAAYGNDLDDSWRGENRHRFVEVMVTDGCFLLEILMHVQDYNQHDPIFSRNGRYYHLPLIRSDMLVMENQLPLLLLDRLVAAGSESSDSDIPRDVREKITNMVVAFYGLPFDNSYHLDGHSLHPIVIARKILCGESERYPDEGRERILCGESERYADEWRERKDSMPSALELYEAGIHFKASSSGSLLDIDFQRGVLSMPVLRVHNYVGTLFLNLMAFEQLRPGVGNDVTEYLIFMDHIIDSAKDVALLRSKGVLECSLGSDKEVAELFNTLSKGAVVMGPSIKLQVVRLRVNAYCRKPLNKWRASLVHTYFRNPWVFISLVAAAVLLVATLLQTIFTIKPLR